MDNFYEVFWLKKGTDDKERLIKVGIMIDKKKDFLIKLDMIPVDLWKGWLIAKKKDEGGNNDK